MLTAILLLMVILLLIGTNGVYLFLYLIILLFKVMIICIAQAFVIIYLHDVLVKIVRKIKDKLERQS